MKNILILAMLLIAGYISKAQSTYSLAVTDGDGVTHNLEDFKGKKILVALLPVSHTSEDSLVVKRLDSLTKAHLGDVIVIAIPSNEDGFPQSQVMEMQQFYRGLLDSSVLISQPINTHQASGAAQDSFFAWLTHADGNTHFEEEVKGPGQMYFINEDGELYAVIGPEAMYSNTTFNKLVP